MPFYKLKMTLLTTTLVWLVVHSPCFSHQSEPESTVPTRRALLREGSELLRVVGTMQRKGPRSPWEFVVPSESADQPEFRFTLLPSRTLQEMQTVTDEHPGKNVKFVMSGDLYVYHNKNYLHPTHAAYRIDDSVPAPQNTTETKEEDEDPSREAPPAGQESIDDLLAQFENRTGPLTRSLNRNQIEATTESALPEGTLMHMRRGRLTRDDDGAWVFLFDADSEGLGDPPVTLLPTSTLQSLEKSVAQTGTATPMLLSGEIVLYRDQRFLIPTLFRTPTQRTRLNP